MATNSHSIKVNDSTMAFIVKLKANIKTVRMNVAEKKGESILKITEPSTPEIFDWNTKYFKAHNDRYQEMIKENVR
jgi:hypothetical protein